jgi:hypothetical protein
MSEDVSEAEVINAAIDSRWLDLHKAGPARVESYNAAANTVTVTPVLWRQIPTDDGDYVAEALPQIPDVKIAWPRAGGFGVTLPIQKGRLRAAALLRRAARRLAAERAAG